MSSENPKVASATLLADCHDPARLDALRSVISAEGRVYIIMGSVCRTPAHWVRWMRGSRPPNLNVSTASPMTAAMRANLNWTTAAQRRAWDTHDVLQPKHAKILIVIPVSLIYLHPPLDSFALWLRLLVLSWPCGNPARAALARQQLARIQRSSLPTDTALQLL